MMLYSRVNLSTFKAEPPAELPANLIGLADGSLADISAAIKPVPREFAGVGYWPVVEAGVPEPQLDKAGRRYLVPIPPPPAPTSADVNTERDRRIRSGFMFAGTPFDYDDSSQKRITGAATLAGFAAAAGAQPGNLRWHGGDSDFVWIAQDNSLIPMDAATCCAFGQAAAAWESANVFAAKAIKDGGVPANYADDALWPGR